MLKPLTPGPLGQAETGEQRSWEAQPGGSSSWVLVPTAVRWAPSQTSTQLSQFAAWLGCPGVQGLLSRHRSGATGDLCGTEPLVRSSRQS